MSLEQKGEGVADRHLLWRPQSAPGGFQEGILEQKWAEEGLRWDRRGAQTGACRADGLCLPAICRWHAA